MRPHNMTLVMLGAGLLWFGWFGFNAGSALGAGTTAAVAWVNTLAATAAAMLGWLAGGEAPRRSPDLARCRVRHRRRPGRDHPGRRLGQPAGRHRSSASSPASLCAYAVGLKYKFGYDDSLDVVGVHLVGGLVGTLLIGFFADPASSGRARCAGLFYGGGLDQLWRQAVGAFAVMVYSFVVSFLIALLIKKTIGLRVSPADELSGIDLAEHSEVGYDLSPVYYTNKVQRTLVLDQGRPAGDREDGSNASEARHRDHPARDAGDRPEGPGAPRRGRHDRSARCPATDASAVTSRSTAARSTPSTSSPRCASRSSSRTTRPRLSPASSSRPPAPAQVGDGKVWIIPVDTVVRVRTGESGATAV